MMRKEVKRFAEEMEKVLKQNDYKSGFQSLPYEYLYKRLLEEVKELFEGIYGTHPTTFTQSSEEVRAEDIVKECVDIANFAMMIADKFLRLENKNGKITTNMPEKKMRETIFPNMGDPIKEFKEKISNLQNCLSANYESAMELKKKIKKGGNITSKDFDLNMILDRSYLHLEK